MRSASDRNLVMLVDVATARISELVKALMTQRRIYRRKESEGTTHLYLTDHPIRSKIQAWLSSQSYFVTFVYPSDGCPFGGSLGTDSLCVDWLNAESLPLAGDRVFHRISRYSCQHSHFWYLQVLSPNPFPDWQNVPLLTLEKAAFKVSSLRWITWALIHFRCHGARPVSYYAFFKGWLLPSPPPGCHRSITSFSTKWLLRDLSVRSGLFPSRLWILAPQKSVCTNDLGLYSEFPWGW